ncbi:redoxin domain-containing protein [Sulfurimonas paralvinellae]|uniref:Redoxin domain-containing protein n=1 Tax=Sulfurimonas paralvinellae TaxID=317658 RepID=A0A7M1BBI8_9BACT|nr:redoxin domain-containing protein [Sulfurimonas paralvinellae]QOP46178.1 redoxin domain-containing protein [Sulfurimonas paralvinellae]
MKSKIKNSVKEILFIIIIMTIATNLLSLYKAQSLSNRPLNIQSFRLINNTLAKVDKNRPIVIHFWATWCPTCKLEAANINLLSRHYQIITIAANSGDDDTIKKYLNEHGYSYRVVNDKDGTLSKRFKIVGYPTTFIYDNKGNLVFKEVGYTSALGLWLRLLWAGVK